jgi:hypothetical protein
MMWAVEDCRWAYWKFESSIKHLTSSKNYTTTTTKSNCSKLDILNVYTLMFMPKELLDDPDALEGSVMYNSSAMVMKGYSGHIARSRRSNASELI